MANQNLKNALRSAGLALEEFADSIQVDPKTAQRWIAGTSTPYPRHRAAISRALNVSEHDLWPDLADPPTSQPDPPNIPRVCEGCDVTGTWAHADDQDTPDLVAFITDTDGPIDVLDSCCGIPITDPITDALLTHAGPGQGVRILTDGTAPRWEALLDRDHIALYLCEIPGEYWLIKTTDRMLLTINLEPDPASSRTPPMLQLTATTPNGLFGRLATRFEELWALTDAPPPASAAPPQDPGGKAPVDTHPAPGTGPGHAEPGSRRWPRPAA